MPTAPQPQGASRGLGSQKCRRYRAPAAPNQVWLVSQRPSHTAANARTFKFLPVPTPFQPSREEDWQKDRGRKISRPFACQQNLSAIHFSVITTCGHLSHDAWNSLLSLNLLSDHPSDKNSGLFSSSAMGTQRLGWICPWRDCLSQVDRAADHSALRSPCLRRRVKQNSPALSWYALRDRKEHKSSRTSALRLEGFAIRSNILLSLQFSLVDYAAERPPD